MNLHLHIRWMISRDMPEVMRIEDCSFAQPWSLKDFQHALRQRVTVGMVAEVNETIVGFMVYELRKASIRLLNFAVATEWRRRGVGTRMVTKIFSKLACHRRDKIVLEVRETNLDAQLFFRTMGFKATKVLRRFYDDDTGEDAYHLRFLLPQEVEA